MIVLVVADNWTRTSITTLSVYEVGAVCIQDWITLYVFYRLNYVRHKSELKVLTTRLLDGTEYLSTTWLSIRRRNSGR